MHAEFRWNKPPLRLISMLSLLLTAGNLVLAWWLNAAPTSQQWRLNVFVTLNHLLSQFSTKTNLFSNEFIQPNKNVGLCLSIRSLYSLSSQEYNEGCEEAPSLTVSWAHPKYPDSLKPCLRALPYYPLLSGVKTKPTLSI